MTDRHARSASVPRSDDRAARVADLRRRVRTGEYRVDPGAVAGALLERLQTFRVPREAPRQDRGVAGASDVGLIAA